MDENQTEDLLNELAVTEAADRAVGDLLAIIGHFVVEMSKHATPEQIAESCARNTRIDQEFIESMLPDCTKEFFNRLLDRNANT